MANISFPPMLPSVSRIFIARLLKAKREGLRIPYPLIDVPQGAPGSPVVDGADQSGTTINLRGLTPGYAAKEGYWLRSEAHTSELQSLMRISYAVCCLKKKNT